MLDWIGHNRDLFLVGYMDIGHSIQDAKALQEEHQHFTVSSMVRARINTCQYTLHVRKRPDTEQDRSDQ